jgi:hypothetical protein
VGFIALGLVLIAAIATAVAAATSHGGSSVSVAPSGPALQGTTFRTEYPAGWTLRVRHPASYVTSYSLSSTRAGLDGLQIPAPGAIGITVSEFPLSEIIANGATAAAMRNPITALAHVVGIPGMAEKAKVITPLPAAKLDGAPAAGIVWNYTYGRVGNIQSDVVALDGGTVVSIELDTEPSLAAKGGIAMATVLDNWHWQ